MKEASLGLRNFTHEEVAELYAQHTAATKQPFEEDAVDLAFHLSQGQPWLVNALAREVVDELVPERSTSIRADAIDDARERLIARQDTHLDSFVERLREPRVRALIEPMIAGTIPGEIPEDDLRYMIELGLVRSEKDGSFRIANPIYHEVVPRALALSAQRFMPTVAPTWLDRDGELDVDRLFAAFVEFWRQARSSCVSPCSM